VRQTGHPRRAGEPHHRAVGLLCPAPQRTRIASAIRRKVPVRSLP